MVHGRGLLLCTLPIWMFGTRHVHGWKLHLRHWVGWIRLLIRKLPPELFRAWNLPGTCCFRLLCCAAVPRRSRENEYADFLIIFVIFSCHSLVIFWQSLCNITNRSPEYYRGLPKDYQRSTKGLQGISKRLQLVLFSSGLLGPPEAAFLGRRRRPPNSQVSILTPTCD